MIRKARETDLPRVLEIYAAARAFMRANGNPTQWQGGHPKESALQEDIALGRLYVAEEDGRIWGCFVLTAGPDDTYRVIENGSWSCEDAYGVIHRVACDGTGKGLVAKCIAFAAQTYPYLRVDTHRDNLPMQRALEKEGFAKRGIIYVSDGTPRIAYDRYQL